MRISDWSSDVCSSDLQRRDGTQADGAQAVLQPLRAGAVLDAAEGAPGDVGAGVLALRRKIALPLDRTLEAAGHRLRRQRLQVAEAGGGEVARDAAHPQAIAAVRRDGNLDDGIVEAQIVRASCRESVGE